MQRPRPLWIIGLALGSAMAASGVFARILSAAELSSRFSWRVVPLHRGVGSEAVRALSADPGGRGFAVGGVDGVSFYTPGGGPGRRLPRVGDVSDLAYDAKGRLWVGSARGLFRYREGEGLVRHVLFAGEASNRVIRVVSVSDTLLVATEGGVFLRPGDGRWERLSAGLPLGAVDALAARPTAGGLEVWLVVAGQLWRVELPRASRGVAAPRRAHRVPAIEGVAVAEVPRQILLDPPGYDVVLVYPRALAFRREGSSHFSVARPAAAPGAAFQWWAMGAGRAWLATEGGLLWADARTPAGPYWRAAPPAGGQPVRRVLVAGSRVLLASGLGLLEAAAHENHSGLEAAGCEMACDPGIRAVQRATLRYAGLEPGRFRALRRAVDVRGWWPTLHLRLGAFVGRERGIDHDQSFSYGEMHHLYDRDGGRERNFDASVDLRWDLAEAVYDPRVVELSRELRQRIALRDDVLDQVQQLYFERQAVLERLRGLAADASERPTLMLRAEALAAGLDGWTGGWFHAARQGRAEAWSPARRGWLEGPDPTP